MSMPLAIECSSPEAGWYHISEGKGGAVVFRFRLSADAGLYSGMAEAVFTANGAEVSREASLGCASQCCVRFVPDVAGEQIVSVEVACDRLDAPGGRDVFAADLVFFVDAVQRETISLRNDIRIDGRSDRAGDSNVNVVLNPDTGKMVSFDLASPRYSRRGDYAPLPVRLKRRESAAATAAAPSGAHSPPCMTLRDGERVIQLTSLRTLTFGKARERTDYALRVYDGLGRCDRPLSRAISRMHFRLSGYERGCFLEDMGSTYGTSLDGKPLAGRAAWISPSETHVVRLCEKAVPRGVLSLTLRAFAGADGAPSGFVLDRGDGADQRVVAVWDEAGVPAGERGWAFRLRDGRFEICAPDGTARALAPGGSVRIGRRAYGVEEFNQPFSRNEG